LGENRSQEFYTENLTSQIFNTSLEITCTSLPGTMFTYKIRTYRPIFDISSSYSLRADRKQQNSNDVETQHSGQLWKQHDTSLQKGTAAITLSCICAGWNGVGS